jgi:hypothetical protein
MLKPPEISKFSTPNQHQPTSKKLCAGRGRIIRQPLGNQFPDFFAGNNTALIGSADAALDSGGGLCVHLDFFLGGNHRIALGIYHTFTVARFSGVRIGF